MVKYKIKKGDKVQVITGRDKGKVGEVTKMLLKEGRIIVKNVNLAKRHTKQTQTQAGGIVHKELPIHISNVSHIDPKTNNVTKIGYKILKDGKKVRYAKRSNEILIKEGK